MHIERIKSRYIYWRYRYACTVTPYWWY